MADAKVRLSIGTRLAFGGPVPLRDQLRYLRDLEDMNLLHIVGGGRADSQSGVYSAMGLVAEHTRRAKVGPLVDNPHTRLPTVAAGEITTIQDISEGRAFFCLGTGGGQARATLRQYDLAPATMSEYGEYAAAVKGLCAGEEVDYHGHRLKLRSYPQPSMVPLYLDASGPRAIRLVGEIGDGAITPYGISRDAVTQLKAGFAEGAQTVDRDPEAIDCWWSAAVMLGKSEEEALEKIKFYLAMRTHSLMSYPERKGAPPELHEPIRTFRREYDLTAHGRPDATSNAALLDKCGLTSWSAARHAILGPPEQVVERLQEIAGWGVTNITFPLWEPTWDARRAAARVWAEKVVPFVS